MLTISKVKFQGELMKKLITLCYITLMLTQTSFGANVQIGENGEFQLDGKPFFPIMQWMQNHKNIRTQADYGINVFCVPGNIISSKGWCDSAAANNVYACVTYKPDVVDSIKDHPGLFGWFFGDEPDLQGHEVTPDSIQRQYNALKAADSENPTFLTLTSRFYSETSLPSWMNSSDAYYYEYPKYTDAIGFDLYPIYGWCRPDWIYQVADALKELKDNYVNTVKPVYAWIECSKTSGKWCNVSERDIEDGPYPGEIEAQVWLAIINGAKAIGYFTHSWECPDYKQWCVSTEQINKITEINTTIASLTEFICEPDADVNMEIVITGINGNAGRIDAVAKQKNDSIYIFAANAVNLDGSSDLQQAAITIPGLNSPVTVYGENRTITPHTDGTIVDTFTLQKPVHIYAMKINGNVSTKNTRKQHEYLNNNQKANLHIRSDFPKGGFIYNLKGARISQNPENSIAKQPLIHIKPAVKMENDLK